MTKKKYNLEDRLIQFASSCIQYADSLTYSYTADVLRKQLIRSASSAALNFGEVQGAESNRDLIHKTRLVLKELKECRVNLRLMISLNKSKSDQVNPLLNETEELIAIFYTIIKNAKSEHK